MALRRVFTLVLTGVCLLHWASPGDRGGQALAAGNGAASSSRSQFALRQPQPAGTRSGLEELTDALTGLEEPLQLEDYFEIIPAAQPNAETLLFTYPPDPATLKLYREEGMELIVLRPEQEPLGADPALLRRLVHQVDPQHLEIFVNEKVGADLLEPAVTPRLRGIHSMGLGFGNVDVAAALRREIHPTYVGGEQNPLRWATAEMAEALALAGRFDLFHRIGPMTLSTPPSQQLGPVLRDWVDQNGTNDSLSQQLLWAQLMRQMRKLDEAGQMVREDRARGAGNGRLRTVEGHQLAADPDPDGSGIQTSLGLLPSSALDVERWGALAHAHGVHRLFYTGPRYEAYEGTYGLVHIPEVYELLRQSDYVLRAPDAPGLPNWLVTAISARRPAYDWLVDPARLALTQKVSREDRTRWFRSVLGGETTVGILGLGSIGSIAAADLLPMGVRLLSFIHDEAKTDRYDELKSRLKGIEYVTLEEMVGSSDILILALPETDETKGFLKLDLLDRMDPQREVTIVNVGRGTPVGATEDEERAFAVWLKAHPNVRYYTDVLRNEFLPNAKQPLLDSELSAQVFYSGHVASNTADPRGGHRTRSAMGKTQFQNSLAERRGEIPPNRVPLPKGAGLEESVTTNLKGVVFLVFDGGLGLAMKKQMTLAGAEVFVVAETPAIALKLISNQVAPDHIVGVLYAPKPEIDSPGVSPADYRKVNDKIRRFAYGEGGPQEWGALFAKRMQEGIARRVIPIYSAEQMQDQLGSLGVPGPVIQQILDQQTGLEEAFAGQA